MPKWSTTIFKITKLMIFNIDNDSCQIYPIQDEDEMVFMQPYEDLPNKRRKPNDEFVLQRFSLVESNEDRKQRLREKREERKSKLVVKESEKSTTVTDHTSSQEVPQGKDLRKIRNRNSAQLSRDRKKAYQQGIMEENQRMRQELEIRNNELRQYIQEVDVLNQQLRVYQDLRSEGSLKCPYCQQQVIPQLEGPTFSRVQNNYSSRSLKTYGLLSLFVVVAMLGCLSTTHSPEVGPTSLIQIRQKPAMAQQVDIESYFHNSNDQVDLSEPFQVSPMEVTTMDQLHHLKNYKFDITDDPSVYNIQVNLRTMEDSVPHHNPEKTLFLNCTASTETCNALVRIMNSRNMHEIYNLSPQRVMDVSLTQDYKQYLHGQEITILQVFEQSNRFIMNTVKCSVDETSHLQLDNDLIDKLTL